MKKLFILFLFVTLFFHTALAANVREDSMGRPLYAADRIKVKLSEVASERLNLVLSDNGSYTDTGLGELDNLFESINVSEIKLAHRPVLDKVWEQENGFNRWYLIFVPIGTDIESTITNTSRNEHIEHANPEYISYYTATPNDTFFDECWGHDNTAQQNSYNSVSDTYDGPLVGTVGFDSHIEEAWDDTQGYGDSSIIIAIIDSGVDYNHEDLDGNCVAGYDYASGDSDPMDELGHGTCCAGVAAAEVNNLIGASGVAGNCKIMPLKISVGTGAPLSTAGTNAITHCGDFSVDIASMSWGGSNEYGDDPARDAAILYAYNNGVTLLAATGNDNISSINNPANDPNVIAVGAASPCAERKDAFSCDGAYWWGSQYGVNTQDAMDAVDVLAPTILPSTDITGADGYTTGDYYMFFSGTSCATPYAAGVAALIKSKYPSFTPTQIRDRLTSTATDVTDEGGIGWDRFSGYGMVNADAAVGPNTWTGDLNEYWGNNANWSLGHVPTSDEYVLIPNINMPCVVDFSNKVCNDLLIASGATVVINDQSLTVHNDLDVYGDLSLTDTASRCYINHDIRWHSGSTGSMTGSATIDVEEDWDFRNGANVQFTAGYVDFSGSATSWLRSYEENCEIYRLRSDKSSAFLNVSELSTDDLHITGNIYNYAASTFQIRSAHSVVIGGFFNNLNGNIYCTDGTLIFDGNPTIVGLKPNVGNYFNNLTFNGSGTLSLDDTYSSDLQVNGNVELAGGTLVGNAFNINVGGSWTNSGGVFSPGTSLVTFDSEGDPQDVFGTNTFYDILQINNGEYLRFYGNTTIHDLELNYFSWAYDNLQVNGTLNINDAVSKFTASGPLANATISILDQGGTVYCNGAATITINDLVESYILGTYNTDTVGGVINISNAGSSVDIGGDLFISGGTINLSGNYCYWAFNQDATITMSDGVLDVTDCEIQLSTAYTLTTDITGGTIKTAYGFTGNRTDYNPTGGTLELYGSTDANLFLAVGSNFYNVLINKSVADNIVTKKNKSSKLEEIRVDRDGIPVEITRSNTINATSDIDINGNLQIDNGTFNLNGLNVDVLNDVKNYGSLTVAASDTLNTGNDMYLYSGSVVDLAGTILIGTRPLYYGDAKHYSGSTFNQTNGDYFVETIYLYDGSQFNGTGGTTHMYANGDSPNTNTIDIDDPDSYFYRFYIDDGANAALIGCSYDLKVNYASQIRAPLDINTYEMNVHYFDVYDNGNLIIGDGGVVNVIGNGPYIHNTATLTMIPGSELSSGSNISFLSGSTENVSGGDIYLEGNFTNVVGIFTPTGGSVTFNGSSASSIIGTTAFYDLNINKTGASVTTNAAFSMHDLAINSGVLNPSGFDIEVTGDWTNNVGDAGFVEGTGTVTFNGLYSSQITTDETFYDLTAANPTYTGWKVPDILDNITINVVNDLNINDGGMKVRSNSIINIGNDLTILNDASLDMSSNYNQLLNIGGDWINDNTTYTVWIGFHPGNNSTVTFNGSADQIITTAAPQEDFENLVIDKSGGDFKSNDNIHVMGDLDIIAGGWHDNAGSLTHYFEGDFYVTAGTVAHWYSSTGNTVVFTGTADQTVYNPIGYYYFRNIIVDKTAWPTRGLAMQEGLGMQHDRLDITNVNEETRALTVTLTSSIDMEFGDGLTIEEGTLDLNGMTLQTMGDIIINDGGKIIVDDGAVLKVDDGDELNVNSGGILEVLGTSGNLATVTNRSTGNYNFNVFSGGTISAEYGLFEYMGSNGLYVRLGGLVDPAHTFDYCTFQNGFPGYAPLVVFNNDQTLTCTEVNFPQVGVSDFNAAKASGIGVITFVDAYGDFAGEIYEFDPGNDQIEWTTGALSPIDDLAIQYNDGANTIVLTWTYPVSVDQFKIYRSTDPYDFTGATVFTTATVGYSEPATGTKYFYYVTAENTSDNVSSREKVSSSDTAPWSK